MSELVLVKTPQEFNPRGKNKSLHGEQVIGIAAPNSSTITEHGYKPTGNEIEETLPLNDYAAGKLVEFYERCRVAAPEDRPFYGCHLLAWYIVGKAVDLRQYSHYNSGTLSVATTALEPGRTYAVQTAGGDLNHSLVGIGRPDYNLSVLGDYSPLAITDNEGLVSFYDGLVIRQTIPESAIEKDLRLR
jgi:hypothetical protein